ncbi:hypothetical protein BDN72DRAFT_959408 [Pluteus cervinus]|uniref:Uncharacterized protein n=1 Tax=Pluteus cervinus TaxID=181527 RepID=A0ACD3AV26_9AGAR|nr:hypothetical protein BDN72DRAFT_959408 [Pluteus cervinus]
MPFGEIAPSLRGHNLWTYISLGFIFSVTTVISLYAIYSCYHTARSNAKGDSEYSHPWTRLNNNLNNVNLGSPQKQNTTFRNSRFVTPLKGVTSPSNSLASDGSSGGETTMAVVQTPTNASSGSPSITTEKASHLMSSNVMGPILSTIVSAKLPAARKVYRKSLYASESQHSINTASNASASSINFDSLVVGQAPRNQPTNFSEGLGILPHPPQVALFFSSPSSTDLAHNLGLQTPPPPRTMPGSPTAAAAKLWNDPKLSPVTGILPLSPQSSLVSIRSKLGGNDSASSTPTATPSKIPQPAVKRPLIQTMRWGKI